LNLDKESFDRIVTWIDINAPYYPTYDSAYPNHLAGRSPLAGDPLARLGALTGVDWNAEQNFGSSSGPWVSFDRPELSPCLEKLDGTSPEYQEALGIIQAGQAALAGQPRGDTLDFTPCERDRQRDDFYRRRLDVELANRQAIDEGKKLYETVDAINTEKGLPK